MSLISERRWTPVEGEEIDQLIETAGPDDGIARDALRESAIEILSQCLNPHAPSAGNRTGLIVGYVQSGKTLSFEAVSALARDNGYAIIILLAGISNLLLSQSTQRFRTDLGLESAQRSRRWLGVVNPSLAANRSEVFGALDIWDDITLPEYLRRTVLVTMLKQKNRIKRCAELFDEYQRHRQREGLQAPLTALIIDDEADQASLNISPQPPPTEIREQSAINLAISELRASLPNHTYLQYTATPQAPLLIDTSDPLSADFAYVLEPGTAYVGAQEFLRDNTPPLSQIPSDDIHAILDDAHAPPPSLVEALRMFLLGVSAGLIIDRNSGSRSMLINPSVRREHHATCLRMAESVLQGWKHTLTTPGMQSTRNAMRADFEMTYREMQSAARAGQLMSFEQIWAGLAGALTQTRLLEVNTRGGPTPEVDWLSYYAWILVGGLALSRGFTVEGLTVTYLGKTGESTNADTVQQRARFYGYKRHYLDYCRVFVTDEGRKALGAYAPHEEHFRRELYALQAEGIPLSQWRRHFLLDSAFQPCRRSILSRPLVRTQFADRWVTCGRVGSSRAVNAQLLREWSENIVGLNFIPDQGHLCRTDNERHEAASECSLATVAGWLARDMQNRTYPDSEALIFEFGKILEVFPSATCAVYRMSAGRPRERGTDASGVITTELFSGPNPVDGLRQGEHYPGDREIFGTAKNQITLQLHYVMPKGDGAHLTDAAVPIPALRIPAHLTAGRGWVIQEESDL